MNAGLTYEVILQPFTFSHGLAVDVNFKNIFVFPSEGPR